jgi:anti-sigma factor RsiW
MKPAAQNHLTDEALDDLLIGLGSPASHGHLEQCAECRTRVDSFRSTIDSFNHASMAWSEAQTNSTAPAPSRRRPIFARPVFAVWAAAALLLAVAGPSAWRVFVPRTVQAPAVAGSQDSESQIAEDNELLQAVNAALATDEKSVVDQYQLMNSQNTKAQPQMRTE